MPARLRLDEVEHELHGDRGIDGRAARAQDLAAGLGGVAVGGGDHVALGEGERPRGGVGCRLGRTAQILRRRRMRKHERGE